MTHLQKIILLMPLVAISVSCVKDKIVKKEEPPVVTTPTVTKNDFVFMFNPMVNGLALVPNTKWYGNASGESFTITKLNYYVSNIVLTDNNGREFAETESYHLIKHVEGVNSFTVKDVPLGTYTGIKFLVGVDSARNVSGAQTGALDPANVMFWEWKSGYIFFKLEGSYASATTNEMEYAVHVGGFTGKFPCLQTVTANLSSPLVINGDKTSTLYFKTQIDAMFKTPDAWGFDKYYSAISDSMFQVVSKHYKNMFAFDRVSN
jgi:hypothetical protein